ncbi:MAG: hypothetical protein EP329_17895 [Deltaproteobacteria bacterium]|nr:MAG: hypothetical protein EP329_17895 [Deltaproteobacteria bacterium]
MDDTPYACRELKAAELPLVASLVERVPRDGALLLRLAGAQTEAFGGWYFGALADNRRLDAVMCVGEHGVHVVGDHRAALVAMAETQLKLQGMSMPHATKQHELMGDAESFVPFWDRFRNVKGRTLIADHTLPLLRAGELPEKAPSKRAGVTVAGARDARLVYELTGEREAHVRHIDPRRTQPHAHKAACEATIAAGRQIIGWEQDKPALVAELRPFGEDTVVIDRIWVPVAYRSRARLVAGALYHALALPALVGKRVLLLAPDAGLAEAAEKAGFAPYRSYRHVILRG